MIKIILISILFSGSNSLAKIYYKDVKEAQKKEENIKTSEAENKNKSIISRQSKLRRKPKFRKGNLPLYARTGDNLNFNIKEFSKTTTGAVHKMKSVLTNDSFILSFDEGVYAIEDQKTNVTGVITSGPLMGERVYGHATLEKYSKKILLNFERLQLSDGSTYKISAQGRGDEGIFLNPSKYFSKKQKWLVSHILTAFTSSWLTSRVGVNQTVFGNTQQTDVKSSGYSAASEGVSAASELFRDALNNSKDVAVIVESRPYTIKFLNSPKMILHQRR